MTQRADRAPRYSDRAHIKKLQLRGGFACHLLDDFHGIRSLDLVPVNLANNRPCPSYRSFIPFELHIVASGFAVVLNPIVNRGTPNEIEQILVEIKENYIANHVAIVVACDELFCLVGFEFIEAVYAYMG